MPALKLGNTEAKLLASQRGTVCSMLLYVIVCTHFNFFVSVIYISGVLSIKIHTLVIQNLLVLNYLLTPLRMNFVTMMLLVMRRTQVLTAVMKKVS